MTRKQFIIALGLVLAVLAAVLVNAAGASGNNRVFLPIIADGPRSATLDQTIEFHRRCDGVLTFPDFPLPAHPCQLFTAYTLGEDYVIAEGAIYRVFYSLPPQYSWSAGRTITLALHVWDMYDNAGVVAGGLRASTPCNYPD
jgi:hypothetical protein